MRLPIVIALVNPQPLEQIAMALEDLRQRGDEQRLAEPPRSREEVDLPGGDEVVDVARLIDLEIVALDHCAEGLHTDG